jgi:MFS family permease
MAQGWLGRWVDRRGNIWVQAVLSLLIPFLPLAWMAATAAWQIVIINAVGGILWAGHALASFNLLLDLAPAEARAEAYAIFQLVIAASATVAPLIGGQIADAVGFGPAFVTSATLRFVGAAIFLGWVARPALRRARQLARAEAAANPAG